MALARRNSPPLTNLFPSQKIVPPVLPFALGSLGFLTNFDFKHYRETMDRVLSEGIRVNLRMRFTCTVYRAVAPDESLMVKKHGKRKAIRRPGGEILVRQVGKDGWEALEGRSPAIAAVPISAKGRDKEIMCFSTRPVEQFEVLNDLVVDRGPSPFVSLLEVFGDDHHLTTVQADGLTVSTPTGSTAYSLSAGGSLVHPQIPALLLTPICPHTLSFRPMLLPDSMELRICVPYNSRSTAWASFDGRGRVELKQGDHIKITASKYPFPTVCADKQSTDWFKSISRTLRWNERERQKSFVVVEEDREPSKPHHAHAHTHHHASANGADSAASGRDEGSDSSESEMTEDEEDAFDIDDRSSGEMTPSPPAMTPAPSTGPQRGSSGGGGPPRLGFMRSVAEVDTRSGVQSPNRFASGGYNAPPPLSQRHLLERLATVESQLRQAHMGSDSPEDDPAVEMDTDVAVDDSSDPPAMTSATEASDDQPELPGSAIIAGLSGIPRCESDATLAPSSLDRERERRGRRDSGGLAGTVGVDGTPRGSRPSSLSRNKPRSRSGSPAGLAAAAVASATEAGAGKKTTAFAFFGQDDSQSEASDPPSD